MPSLNALKMPAYLIQIFRNYFQGRTAEKIKVHVLCGVPQGLVVGLLLWNIVYDRVLRLLLQTDTELLGFADDNMIIVAAKSIMKLEQKANEPPKYFTKTKVNPPQATGVMSNKKLAPPNLKP